MIERPSEPLIRIYQRYVDNPEQLDADSDLDVAVSRDDVLEDMATQSERYLHWARLAAIADAVCEAAEDEKKREAFVCKLATRKRYEGSKVTEARIEEESLVTESYMEAQRKYLLAYEFKHRIKAVEKAMEGRMAMLQSMNSRQVKELGADTGMRKEVFPQVSRERTQPTLPDQLTDRYRQTLK